MSDLDFVDLILEILPTPKNGWAVILLVIVLLLLWAWYVWY